MHLCVPQWELQQQLVEDCNCFNARGHQNSPTHPNATTNSLNTNGNDAGNGPTGSHAVKNSTNM
jgi:hypothetical protein